jgi:hypothetical protein
MHSQIVHPFTPFASASYQGTSSLVPDHASLPRAFASFASRRSRPGSPCRFPSRLINVDREPAEYARCCPSALKFPQYPGNSSTGSTSESQLQNPKNTVFSPSFHSNFNKISTLQCIVLGIPCSFINLHKPWCKILREWSNLSRLGGFSHSIKNNPSHFGTPPRTLYPLYRTPSHPSHRGVECILLNRASGT